MVWFILILGVLSVLPGIFIGSDSPPDDSLSDFVDLPEDID